MLCRYTDVKLGDSFVILYKVRHSEEKTRLVHDAPAVLLVSVRPHKEIPGIVVTYMEVIISIIVLYNVIECSWRAIRSSVLDIAFMARIEFYCMVAIWYTWLRLVRDKGHNLMQNIYVWRDGRRIWRSVSGGGMSCYRVIGSRVRNVQWKMKEPGLLICKPTEMPFVHLRDGIFIYLLWSSHAVKLLTYLLHGVESFSRN